MDEGPPPPDPLQEGIRLFNEGYFFEAHEIWEGAWHATRGEPRLFVQGLIQVAAGLHHFQQGNLTGASNLLEKAFDKLRRYPAEYLGFDNRTLIEQIDGLREVFRRRTKASSDDTPVEFPKLVRNAS